MKTKKANKKYKCYLCEGTIDKGDQYAHKSVVIGKESTWNHGKDCKCCGGETPEWAWTPARATMPVCNECANPKEVAA